MSPGRELDDVLAALDARVTRLEMAADPEDLRVRGVVAACLPYLIAVVDRPQIPGPREPDPSETRAPGPRT